MSGVILRSNHPQALWPGIKAWWGRTYDEHAEEYPDLFEIEGSTRAYEKDVQLTGFGLAPVKDEGSGVKYDSESQGYTTTYTHINYMLGYICSEEEQDDGLYEQVSKRRSQANAFSVRQTTEIVGANIYNRATNSDYKHGDGLELLSSVHPSSAGTWSNELATPADLSEAAIEDLTIQIMIAENDKGHKINLMPQSLHIHPSEFYNANRILKSTLQSDSANNDINVLKLVNAFPKGIKMNHYFTDTDAWFIRTNAPRGMIMYKRKETRLKQDNDFDTGNAKAKSGIRCSFGNTDPRGLYGSAGA